MWLDLGEVTDAESYRPNTVTVAPSPPSLTPYKNATESENRKG